MPRPGRRRPRSTQRDVKDRLIQTRVPERLESVLKEEAHKRRLTVSHLIRNMLEDTLNLVDTVVTGAEEFVGGSVDFAEQVAKDATKIATTAREAVRGTAEAVGVNVDGAPRTPAAGAGAPREEAPAGSEAVTGAVSGAGAAPRTAALDHVLAWNQVVVNRPATCASCGCELPRGSVAHLGVGDTPGMPPAWLCTACLERL